MSTHKMCVARRPCNLAAIEDCGCCVGVSLLLFHCWLWCWIFAALRFLGMNLMLDSPSSVVRTTLRLVGRVDLRLKEAFGLEDEDEAGGEASSSRAV